MRPLHDLRELLVAGEDSEVAWCFESGQAVTRGELRQLAESWPGPAAPPCKLLVAIIADNSKNSLRELVCALVAGHAVILLPADSPEFAERVERAFDPHIVAGPEDGQWVLRRRHSRDLGLHSELALLLSTSGSTGENKFVRLSYRNLLSNAGSIVEYLGLNADERGLLNLPLHYSYGLSIVTSHLLCGASLLVTLRSVSDPALWTQFEEARCTSIAGVPHSYALMASSGFLQRRLASLKMMTQAGGRLPEPLARQFAEWCRRRGVRFFIMYGQTEASPRIAYLPPQSALAHAGCIGRAVPGGELSLVGAEGRPICEPEVEGELVYRGPNVMMGYATALADLGLPAGPAVLRTGDLAVIDGRSGFFRLTGRTNRFLKLFGLRISLDEVERRLEQAGHEVICTGSDDALGVVTRSPASGHAALRTAAARAAAIPEDSVVVCAVEAWPRLTSGKTDHRALKNLFMTVAAAREGQAAAGAAAPPVPARISTPAGDAGPSAAAGSVQGVYEALLGVRVGSSRSSFKDLGGDSLTYVRASIALQRLIPELPRDWPDLPIAALQGLASAPSRPRGFWSQEAVETSVVLRAIAPILVVMFHFGPRLLAGGAALLMMVVGYNISRFMRDHIVADRWGVVLRSLVSRVLMPYWLIVALYGLAHEGISLPDMLLVGNFMGTHATDLAGIETWFVATIAQSMLLLFVVTRVSAIREGLAARPFATAAGLLALAVGMRALEPMLLPQVWAANEGREFTWTFWLFALGLVVHAGHAFGHRFLASGAIVALSMMFYGGDWPRIAMLSIGGFLLVWTDRLKVPRLFVPAIGVVASASLFIYLLHLRAHENAITSHWPVDVVRVAAGIAIGIAGWWIYERGLAAVRQLISRVRRPLGAGARIDF